MAYSKLLGHDDTSGFEFAKRALGDHVTAAVNFDRLQKHPTKGYIIFEFLKCDEKQWVSPYTSHPNRYWDKNTSKFLSLWRAKQDFQATLYLVNYADAGTKHEDQVLLIEVLDMDETGITQERKTQHTMQSFSEWFVKLNDQCLAPKATLVYDIYKNKSVSDLGKIRLGGEKYRGKSLEEIYRIDPSYLEWFSRSPGKYAQAAKCYLEKLAE